MDTLALAAALTVMAAIIVALLAVYEAAASPRASLQRRLGSVLGDPSSQEVSVADFEALRPKKAGRMPIISSFLEGRSWTAGMAEQLELADMKLTVSEFVALRLICALMFAMLPMLALGTAPIAIGLMALAGVAGYGLPGFYLGFAKKKRVKKIDTQLVEGLSLIANSLKAGFGLMQSFELASRQLEHPIATELRRTLYDINVGSTTEAALQALSKRSGSNDFDIVVTAMLIQQSTGGNLAEILDNVAQTMRERIRIRGEITTLTSQQMLTGMIIGGLPFLMAAGFSILSPDYMKPLITTSAGHIMLGGGLMLETFGIFLIRQILAIEV